MKAIEKALLIDHDDSFTHNLRHWLLTFCSEIEILNHRELTNRNLENFDLIVLSPGPKHPSDYPHVLHWLKNYSLNKPVFGVCLGMQLLILAEQGRVDPYAPPKHGKTSVLNSKIKNLQGLKVARYHSLACEPTSDFEILAESQDDKLPMMARHRKNKWLGVQFHPESFLTENSTSLQKYVQNWAYS